MALPAVQPCCPLMAALVQLLLLSCMLVEQSSGGRTERLSANATIKQRLKGGMTLREWHRMQRPFVPWHQLGRGLSAHLLRPYSQAHAHRAAAIEATHGNWSTRHAQTDRKAGSTSFVQNLHAPSLSAASEGPGAFSNPMFKSHEDYVQAQRSKTDGLLKQDASAVPNWVTREDVQFLARHMQMEMHLPFHHKFALAHGTRSGREQSWFMEFLPGVRVLGTELSPLAAGPNTVVMDFHEVKPEWVGQADFVYSNALDHSYNATFAVQQWMKEVSPEGMLIVEWSMMHTKAGLHGKVDIFGGTLDEFQDLIRNAGPFQIAAVVKNPKVGERRTHYIFARHADHA